MDNLNDRLSQQQEENIIEEDGESFTTASTDLYIEEDQEDIPWTSQDTLAISLILIPLIAKMLGRKGISFK